METNMIIVKKELLNKLLSKNYLDETGLSGLCPQH